MAILDYLLPKEKYPVFLDPEINKIGDMRENIVTLERSPDYKLKALFRTYYLENKVVVIISRFNGYGISNNIEYFVQRFCYENCVSSDKLTFYEVVDPIFNIEMNLKRLSMKSDFKDNPDSYMADSVWKDSLSIEQFEKIIGRKFEPIYFTSLKSLDHLKQLTDARLQIIPYSMTALHSLDGLYDIKDTLKSDGKPFLNEVKFYSKLKKVVIKCKENKLIEIGESSVVLEVIKYPEHFYKISEKFANRFDGFEFDGLRLGNDFIIARTRLEKLIVEKYMNLQGNKLGHLIDDDELKNLYAVADYIVCTNLAPVNLKLIPTDFIENI